MNSVTINTQLPISAKNRGLSPKAKWVLTVLMCNPSNEASGLYSIDPHVLADYAEMSPADVSQALNDLEATGMITRHGEHTFIPALMRAFLWQRRDVRDSMAYKLWKRYHGSGNKAYEAWCKSLDFDLAEVVANRQKKGGKESKISGETVSSGDKSIDWNAAITVSQHTPKLPDDQIAVNLPQSSPIDVSAPLSVSTDPNTSYSMPSDVQTINTRSLIPPIDPYQSHSFPHERLDLINERLDLKTSEGGAGGDFQSSSG